MFSVTLLLSLQQNQLLQLALHDGPHLQAMEYGERSFN